MAVHAIVQGKQRQVACRYSRTGMPAADKDERFVFTCGIYAGQLTATHFGNCFRNSPIPTLVTLVCCRTSGRGGFHQFFTQTLASRFCAAIAQTVSWMCLNQQQD